MADIDAAMARWTGTLRVGPFFVKRRIALASFVYRGKAWPSPSISIALAASGGMQIELIAQHDDLPSVFLEWLVPGRDGPHHVSSWHTSEELAALSTTVEGATMVQSATIAASGAKLLYWETEPDGSFFETSSLADDHHRDRLTAVERAAAAWTGEAPIREVDR